MGSEMLDLFCEEYTRHLNKLISQTGSRRSVKVKELAGKKKEKGRLITAIESGINASLIKDDLEEVSKNIKEIETFLERSTQAPRPLVHPSMALRCREELKGLKAKLGTGRGDGEIVEHIRSLVDKIVLTPKEDSSGLSTDLNGDLAGLVKVAEGHDKLISLHDFCSLPLPRSDNKSIQVDRIGSGGQI